jgi:hypothetical protein
MAAGGAGSAGHGGERFKKVAIFVAGLVFGWLTDHWFKEPFLHLVDYELQTYIPWDSPWVQLVWPNSISFEATEISGCSGGELRRLVTQAETQGMQFPERERVSNTRLCQQWTYHGSAHSILEHMATRFDKCFSLDQTNNFSIRLNETVVCKTDFALNPATNEWMRTPGAVTFLCLNPPVNTPMSQSEPVAHVCPESALKRLQFNH